ncbi:DUF5712 family protein [Dyadobacter sp. CY347]|uniref:DUF5712 family protein n=1 Tax=Dyadobacter sp. CY347 TaxID=2909336 RepID=UPI001F3A0B8B|nr:DUF5712 family protein [Dyadobacter sp. CY347]MCF2490776.1 DUF5712 family protein [Dyadobacter sp. CY347]
MHTGHSQKLSGGPTCFTECCKKTSDQTFGYERKLAEPFQYRKVVLNATAIERADMIVAERNHQAKQAKEQSQAFEQNKREKKELAQQPEINAQQ